MKHLLRFAVGAITAGVLVNMLMKRRSGEPESMQDSRAQGPMAAAGGPDEVRTSVDEMVPDTNTVSGGDATREQSSPQPQDWRGAQNVLDS